MPTNCAIHIYDFSFSNARASETAQKYFFCGPQPCKRGQPQTQGRLEAQVPKTNIHLGTTAFTSG